MTYSNHMAACIKVNGSVLREKNGIVSIPFGSEYEIQVTNRSDKRAVVSIYIDGSSIGRKLVVNANSTATVERFLNDDLNKGYKFRFIRKNKAIKDFRGDKAEDGMVRIEYQFEKPYVPSPIVINWIQNDYKPYDTHPWNTPIYRDQTIIGTSGNPHQNMNYSVSCSAGQGAHVSSLTSRGCNARRITIGEKKFSPQTQEGITAPGADSHQRFTETTVGELEIATHTMIIKLTGYEVKYDTFVKVGKPLLVKDKIKCKLCGRTHSSSENYCGQCGSRLVR